MTTTIPADGLRYPGLRQPRLHTPQHALAARMKEQFAKQAY
ncbi:hypothetical protein [Hymenobacter perfusus]|nr:hypothetical protein [Hymenobacter perfusus]